MVPNQKNCMHNWVKVFIKSLEFGWWRVLESKELSFKDVNVGVTVVSFNFSKFNIFGKLQERFIIGTFGLKKEFQDFLDLF